ncbi:MAG: hypothetical protein ACRDFY_00570 [Candidatus Limnocylindria bacterium]
MDGYPRRDRVLFEQLCLLRALYARRGSLDGASVMSVEGAIRYAETLLAFSRPATGFAERSADSTV